MSDVGLLVGPQGFEPWTDGLKVSGSSFKTAGKTHENRTKLQENAGKTQISGRQPGHFRYKWRHMATPKKGWKRRSQAKTVHRTLHRCLHV